MWKIFQVSVHHVLNTEAAVTRSVHYVNNASQPSAHVGGLLPMDICAQAKNLWSHRLSAAPVHLLRTCWRVTAHFMKQLHTLFLILSLIRVVRSNTAHKWDLFNSSPCCYCPELQRCSVECVCACIPSFSMIRSMCTSVRAYFSNPWFRSGLQSHSSVHIFPYVRKDTK